jgi:hypothetical protein
VSVILTKDATVVTLPDPLAPYTNKSIKKFNTITTTDGGVDYVYDKGITKYIYPMRFVVTTEATITALRSFFDTTANGMVESFVLTDPFAATPIVRFNQQELEIIEHKKQGVYEFSLEFVSA